MRVSGRLSQLAKQLLGKLTFDDHHAVFSHKTNWELLRALSVLLVCGSDRLVDNSLPLLRLADRLGLSKLVLKPTVYAQFVAGNTEQDLSRAARDLKDLNLRLMVAPTLEEDKGEASDKQEKYDRNLSELVNLAEMVSKHGGRNPCLQTKITSLLSADTLVSITRQFYSGDSSCTSMVEKVAAAISDDRKSCDIQGLTAEESNNLRHAVRRLSILGKAASSKSVRLLVDAEYSYVNGGCSLMTLAMMTVFNQLSPVIGYTYQCYFKGASDMLSQELKILEELGACFAAKLVRGAYLEKERQQPVPLTCESYEATGINYCKVMDQALDYVVENRKRPSFLVVATHNESAIHHAVEKLGQLGMRPDQEDIAFAQIYGMAEQISVPLAAAGYTVYKSVPVGGLGQALPYLARRLAENRSVLAGARHERQLLQRELRRRLRPAGATR
ncbi:hydroxyproline dehydrogenase-like [Schistocerca piceifrons]|uniref:hydroxyproline dehydrogenase-like n=1 Tax=Schistocerca piceifrons TaxID=274613 RepID=UPI001F5F5C33|nr:hydroxyproline dehydrogenase-like [Schistocerca piceifrons]